MEGDEWDLEWLSLELEEETGFDSIPTIERVYDRSDRGSIFCPYPGCRYSRRDPVAIWWHVHFGFHGLSFDARSPAEVVERRRSAAPQGGS
jgi:8-oxo-dGTP pyrophosphatase MutT (NUDIX family)